MSRSRMLPAVCATLALAGCATAVTPVVAVPGPNKDAATFQKDEADCRGTAAQAVPSAGANTNAKWASYFGAYSQCATAHGDHVQPVPWSFANVGFGNPYPAYGYGYGYGYPYGGYAYGAYDPFFYGYPYGFYPGFFGFGYGFGYGRFGYGRFGYGYGGFHGGGFHGGFAGGGGFHGGGGGFHH